MGLTTVVIIAILALGLSAAPLPANAQQAGKVYRIGHLSFSSPPASPMSPYRSRVRQAILQGLRAHGFVEGQNLIVERRYAAGKMDRLHALAVELVQLGVEVIYTWGHGVRAARNATTTIPIVAFGMTDPVASGRIKSLARPGGNITGFISMELGLDGKRLELLKVAVPGATRIAVLGHPDRTLYARMVKEVEAMASSLGVQLHVVEVHEAHELEGAFAAMRQARAEALLLLGHSMFVLQRRRIADLAVQSHLPAMCFYRAFVQRGCLMSYGPDHVEVWRRVGDYVGQILKGANPAELPVQQPTTFELLINLKTAKALGLTMPPMLLYQADEVIR